MAVRYRSYSFKDFADETWKIEISDDTFSGTVFEFEAAPDSFMIRRQGEGDNRISTIEATLCEVDIYLTNPTLNNMIGHLAEGPEGRFTMAVYKGSTPALYWAGVVEPKVSEVQDLENPAFRISATCGLGLLKKIDFLDGTDPYTGNLRLVQIIAECLKKIPSVPLYYSSADPFLITADNMYAAEHSVTATYDPLYYTFLEAETFIKRDENGGYTPWKCFDVLEAVCISRCCAKLWQTNGAWYFEQLETRAFEGTSYWRKYAYAIGSPAAYTHTANIGGNPFRPRIATMTYSYLPALNKVRVTQKIGGLRNLLLGNVYDSDNPGPTVQTVFVDGDASTLQFSGAFEWSLTNISVNPYFTFFLEFFLYVRIGSKYIRQNVTFSGNAATVTGLSWQSGGTWKFTTKPIFPLPLPGGETHDTTEWNDIIGVDPSLTGQQTMTINTGIVGLFKSDGTLIDPTHYTVSYKLINPYLVIASETAIKPDKFYKDSKVFQAANPTANNSEEIAFEMVVGDAEELNQLGALLTYNGSEYVHTSDWGMRAAGGDGKAAQVVANRILAGQMKPIQTLNGSVDGDDIYKLLYVCREEDGHQWYPAGLSFTPTATRMTGTWYDLVYSDETPVTDAPPWHPGEYGLTKPPPLGPTSKGGPSYLANPWTAGGQAAAVGRITWTTDFIPEGAITTLNVEDALAGGQILSGDTLFLFNHATNDSIEATVTADVSDGNTAISLTATIPEGGLPAHAAVVYGWASRFQQGGTKALKVGDTNTIDLTLSASTNTLSGDARTQMSITSDASGLKLSGDASTPGNSKYYGTDSGGTKGFFSLPAGGSGTVTDFTAGNLSPLFTTSVATSTTTPALTFSLSNAAANTYLGNATGGSAAPSYTAAGALTKTDDTNVTLTLGGAPSTALLTAASLTLGWTGTLAIGRGGTGLNALGTANQLLRVNAGATALEYFTPTYGSGDILNGGNTTGAAVTIGTNDNFALQFETNNVVRVSISSGASTGGDVTLTGITANTSTIQDRLTIQTNSSGTAAAGFGSGVSFQQESTTTDNREAVRLETPWTTATDATRTADWVFKNTVSGSSSEHLRIVGAATPVLKIGAGSTTYGNAAITLGTSFTLGGSSQALTIGGSNGAVTISTANASFTNPITFTATADNSTSQGVKIGTTTFTTAALNRPCLLINDSFTASTGSGTLRGIEIAGTYNLTGTANGAQSGILITPTLTSLTAATYRAVNIAADHANAFGIYQSGTSTTNLFNGATTVNNYTKIRNTANTPTSRAVFYADGVAVAAPTSVSTPAEDAIATFHGNSAGTQVDTQLRVGAYSTATNGNWLQASSISAYDTQRPLRLQPLGGKVGIGKFGATPPTAYCTIFGNNLGTSGLSASTLHVAQTGETSTTARISLGTNDTLSTMWMYDGAAQVNRFHATASGTTVTHRWGFGNTEFGDVMTLQPSASTTLGRLGIGYANTTGLHSTLQSAGSFASGMLETAGAPTFDETKHEVWYTGSTNQTYTIPAANTCTGREYWIGHAGTAGTITLSVGVSAGNGVTITTIGPGELVKMKAGVANWRGHKW